MKTKQVPSAWLLTEGRRLDARPYLSGGREARDLLKKLSVRKEPLHTLTHGHDGGIYNGPHFGRVWVEDSKYGVPFVGSSSMLEADLSPLPLLRKQDALSPKLSYLRLEEGMTLISCSGTIGRMVYARPEMANMWSSQHLMKVVPDPAKIPPGYLYAFLSSKFGVPLVIAGTYGSIIQSIEPEHLRELPVPRLVKKDEEGIADFIHRAGHLRSQAAKAIRESGSQLIQLLKLAEMPSLEASSFGTATVKFSTLDGRLDATYHSAGAQAAESILRAAGVPVEPLGKITARLFKPPIFKRLWVDGPEYGAQFISGLALYKLPSTTEPRYVSHRTPNYESFILKKGWLVFQAAGQTYGLFGRPVLVHGWTENTFCADDVFRVVAHDDIDAAFLYAWFRTPHGRVLLVRQASGDSIPRVWEPHVN